MNKIEQFDQLNSLNNNLFIYYHESIHFIKNEFTNGLKTNIKNQNVRIENIKLY